MTREDYEDVEGYAVAAMIGLSSSGQVYMSADLATAAFDHAEALLAEKKKRLGEKPDFRHAG